MIDSPLILVDRYRALPFPSDSLGDCAGNHGKYEILRELDRHANDLVVSQLLLDILSTPDEYDLARAEALKIVRLYVDGLSPLEQQLKHQVWQVFSNTSEDTLVRQYASQNFCVGYGGHEELDIIERILFYDEDDLEVRHGAFSYLRRSNNPEFVNRLLPRLRAHTEWCKYIDRLGGLSCD